MIRKDRFGENPVYTEISLEFICNGNSLCMVHTHPQIYMHMHAHTAAEARARGYQSLLGRALSRSLDFLFCKCSQFPSSKLSGSQECWDLWMGLICNTLVFGGSCTGPDSEPLPMWAVKASLKHDRVFSSLQARPGAENNLIRASQAACPLKTNLITFLLVDGTTF